LVVRFHQQRWEYFSDPWNIFDYICVSMGSSALVQPAQAGSANADVANLRVVKTLKALRILRLMRVVRHIGGLKMVEGLWLLVSGLLSSVKTLFWVGVCLIIMVYTFSVALMTILDEDHEVLYEQWGDAKMYVGSVSGSMWTMFEVITFDAWSPNVFRPLVNVAPGAAVVLFAAIVVMTFGALNVILGVMVEHMRSTMEATKTKTASRLEDTEAKMIQSMGQDFRSCDRDSDGELQYKEFMKLLKKESFAYRLRLIGVQNAEAEQLFHLMDSDKSGSVTPEEFINGLNKIKGPAAGKDVVQMISLSQKQSVLARKYVAKVKRLSDRASELQRRLNTMGRGMTAEVAFRTETKKHGKQLIDRARLRNKAIRTLHAADKITYPSLG